METNENWVLLLSLTTEKQDYTTFGSWELTFSEQLHYRLHLWANSSTAQYHHHNNSRTTKTTTAYEQSTNRNHHSFIFLLLYRGMASPNSAQSSATAADQSQQLQTLPALQDVGNNGSPSSAFPLGICEGDCDSNAECQLGLICYQRDGLVEVPGCSGSGTSGTDYCIDREPDELAVIANDGSPSELFPLGNCEGDCDNDSECSL